MKLNTECLRDVMIKIEEEFSLTLDDDGLIQMETMEASQLYEALPQYSHEEIFYVLFNLEQAEYVDLTVVWTDDNTVMHCRINHMTYTGHEFLARIRDNNRWGAVKKGLQTIKDFSLSAISAVAEGVANAAIGKFIENADL